MYVDSNFIYVCHLGGGESAMRQGEKCGLGSVDGESVQVKVASARDKRTRIVKVPTSTINLRHHCGGARMQGCRGHKVTQEQKPVAGQA